MIGAVAGATVAGSAGCGTVICAVAAGGGATTGADGMVFVPPRAAAALCRIAGALAAAVASWSMNGTPGDGAGAGAGWAAAVALHVNATATAPPAAITLLVMSFLVARIVLPIPLTACKPQATALLLLLK
ncbi:uncharacterized protein RMCT_3073 [Mycolicibacterium thermoresistibile]|uniref:Uncharacterized protein n=1 Tax=Mycolicibacterium thermoresistibile TaxID=1797 RepID=A0A124E8L5_MYCTH|nr:uncharacterized protein RMCT_3073 [Mycolicibacterium thermoresistibile]